MNKLKLNILNLGGKLYYSDTDSIVTDKELPAPLISTDKLGLLKLEHVLLQGIFISNKIYYLLNTKWKFIIKAKGMD